MRRKTASSATGRLYPGKFAEVAAEIFVAIAVARECAL
jgi:hypothetical protein